MTPARRLAVCAVVYNVAHHLGLLPGVVLGGGTRWNDWLDLLVPYAVVGSALAVLAGARTDGRGWVAALAGAVLYVQGHALHLAANSVANARGDAAPVHLWDEVVGHALWYAGVALLAAVLVRAVDPLITPASVALALVTGLTWTTNALGADGLTVAGALTAAVLAAYGFRLGTPGGRLLVVGFVPSALVLGVAPL